MGITIILVNEIDIELDRETYTDIEPNEAIANFIKDKIIQKGDKIIVDEI